MARRAEHRLPNGVTSTKRTAHGTVRRRAPQLLVHEVGEAAEEQAERHAAGDIIVDPQPRQFLLAREIEDAERRADHAAVERHAAVPQLQDLDRVPEIFAEIVEQHIAEAAAEDDPERGVEDEVVGMAAGHRRAGLLEQLQQIPIADEDAGEVGEAVPAEVERPDVQRDRRQAEVGKGDEAGSMSSACKGFPMNGQRLIRRVTAKAKEGANGRCRANSTAGIDEMLAEVTGPGGRLVIEQRRAGPGDRRQFPGDAARPVPHLLRAQRRQRGGGRRRRAADLRRTRPHFRAARARARRARDRQGRPRRHRHAQLPGLGRQLHGDRSRRAGSRPCSTAGGKRTRWSMRSTLTEPKLIIADAPRAKRIAARCAGRRSSDLADRAAGRSRRSPTARTSATRTARCPRSRRKTMRRSCSPRARPAKPRARCRPTAR